MPSHPPRAVAFAALALALLASASTPAASQAQTPPPAPTPPPPAEACPGPNFTADLQAMLAAGAAFPTDNTVIGARDCAFHEWSWEAFMWATALDTNGRPRFMSLKTPADLSLTSSAGATTPPPSSSSSSPMRLSLGMRAAHASGATAAIEGAGAIVEADGNMLVSQNGYPVYASVHMNDLYFTTAQNNLIVTGAYTANVGSDEFPVGAAVFKAMWLRLDDPSQAPAGAFVTQAEVPILTVFLTADNTLYAAPSGQTTTVSVALVGLHVVGRTIHHPEFIWGTFEHHANSPRFADGTFNPSSTASNPNSYTLYAAGTPYNQTNQPSTQTTATATPLSAPSTTITLTETPTYTFNPATQKFTPSTNVILANATGGETHSPRGPANIASLNTAAQGFLASLSPTIGPPNPQSTFAHYDLIGTVWMAPGTLTPKSNQSNAVGSVNLSNSTAETFVQNLAGTTTPSTVQNCFSCHNPMTFQDVAPLPNLVPRKVALSHVVATGSLYAVPNLIPVNAPPAPAAAK